MGTTTNGKTRTTKPDVCLLGTLNLAKGAAIAGVSRIVGVGTCFEYDLSVGMLSTVSPLKPTTPYAASKVATYLSLSQYLEQQSIDFSWCRIFYLYGEGEDERRLVPYIRSRVKNGQVAELSSGNQIRDFLDVTIAGK
jgi:nucleoside-diphosphate-sugar epimerase